MPVNYTTHHPSGEQAKLWKKRSNLRKCEISSEKKKKVLDNYYPGRYNKRVLFEPPV